MAEEQDFQRIQSALSELKSINRVIDRVCRARETNHMMSIIIDELIGLTGASQGVVNLTPSQKDENLATVIRGTQTAPDEIPYKVHAMVSGWVLKNNRILKVDDLDNDDRFRDLSSDDGKFKAIICCPMVVRGETIGLTSLVRDANRGPFTDDQCRLAGIIISQSAHILCNSILMTELAGKNELLELSQRKLHEENLRLKAELDATFSFENIIGKSQSLKNVLTLASKVAGNDSPLLITGATGTGKELMARAIHHNSDRRARPFVVKNCGIKTESLLEAELFGYVKGAFTGADKDKPGLFREANGGSIFLDEIGEAPPSTQVAILRVIETGEIRPVGSAKTEYVNVRVISATNRDLKEEIKKGTFREDLFYRLNTFTIELPPLSRRRDDIPLLVHHFLGKLRIKLGNEYLSITARALEALGGYSWPGNVRQLENEVERAAVVSHDDGVIDLNDLSPEIIGASAAEQPVIRNKTGKLRDIVEEVERDLIRSTLKDNDGNILRTSTVLGLTRKGLKEKMARYDISSGRE
jgi:transcriptional regulator with GAF, ATPase, and Fis domain